MELLKVTFGLDIAHVPFRGGGPAAQAVLSGHVPIGCVTLPPVNQLIQAGQLRGLAVTSSKRFPTAPELPTMAEAGFAGQESSTWQGVFVPAGTPKSIVDYLYSEIKKVVDGPGMRDKLVELGFTAIMGTGAELAAQVQAEVPKWQRVIKEANIKP
jgi:tripartite-type tricarboxylate transporter receptor subunit TctC